jgi:hypothetical protein
MLRSLLQKAVRRGSVDIVRAVVSTLASRGDTAWLHARAGVIVFEECWYLASSLNETPSVLIFEEASALIKNKNAAGLGSLAFSAVDGNSTAIHEAHDPVAVKIVAAAFKRPESFFKWASSECASPEQLAVVHAAQKWISRASWPWDKAFMIAGAYLSCQGDVYGKQLCTRAPSSPFSYWAAVDKHTRPGKIALRQLSAELGISSSLLEWANFYFESAKTNELSESVWWESERKWRFRHLGVSVEDAENIWMEASKGFELKVEKYADLISKLIEENLSNSGEFMLE